MRINFLAVSKTLLALLAMSVSVVLLLFVFVLQAEARGFPLYSWGQDGGRLGRPVGTLHPENAPANRPGRVGERDDWVLVASASGGSKGIDTQGRLWTWGPSGDQRGLGPSPGTISEPTQVGSADNWVHVASLASVVAAVNDEGHLYTWGVNSQGRLGHGHDNVVNVPTRVYTEPGCTVFFTQVSVGTSAGGLSLALTDEGYIYSWGAAGASGVGRLTDVIPANRPGRVVNPQNVAQNNWVQVESGLSQSGKAICTQGYLYSWGATGTIGRTATGANPANRPGRVENPTAGLDAYLSNVVDVVMTSSVAAAVTRDPVTEEGRLYTWGPATADAIGRPVGSDHPNGIDANRPGRVDARTDWSAVMGGWQHFIALRDGGAIFAWGANSTGQLGLGDATARNRPTSVGYIIGAAGAARGGGGHSLVIMDRFSPYPAVPDEVYLNKELRKLDNTTMPNLNFVFDVERNSFNGGSSAADLARLPDIPLANRSITITSASASSSSGGVTALRAYVNLLEDVVFIEEGIYSWIITEVDESSGINANPLSNLRIGYSQASYELRVYVNVPVGAVPDPYIDNIVLRKLSNDSGTAIIPPTVIDLENNPRDFVFTNTFQRWSSGTNTCAGALTVSKEIDGDFVDPATPFTFEVTLTGTALCVAGTEFTARVYGPNNNFIRTESFEVGETETVILLDEQTLVFPYLPVGLTWEVEELELLEFTAALELTVNGVTNPRVTNPNPQLDLSTGVHTITAENLRNSAHFINIHFITPPMGLVIGNGAAYLVVAAAGLMLGTLLVLKVKRRVEDTPSMY